MKKSIRIISVLLSLLLIIAIAGCSSNSGSSEAEESKSDSEGNEITRLFNEGYECIMSTYDESEWKGVLQKPESFDSVFKVTAKMTAEKYEEFESVSFEDEDYDEKKNAVLGTLSDVVVTDVTEMVPSQEELDVYVGKTLGDLEDDGFENSGNTNWDGIYTFYYDGPDYSVTVDLKEGTVIEDMDDYSVNDLRELEIGAVKFTGFSYGFLDN